MAVFGVMLPVEVIISTTLLYRMDRTYSVQLGLMTAWLVPTLGHFAGEQVLVNKSCSFIWRAVYAMRMSLQAITTFVMGPQITPLTKSWSVQVPLNPLSRNKRSQPLRVTIKLACMLMLSINLEMGGTLQWCLIIGLKWMDLTLMLYL
jgi:hypothetical protein